MSERDERVIAGVGCRPGCDVADVLDALACAAALAGVAPGRLAAPAFRRDAPGLLAAARRLELPILWVGPAALAAAQPRCPTRSEASLRTTGIASVAEGSALAAAGPGGVLLLARLAGRGVTVALAALPLAGARCAAGDGAASDGDAMPSRPDAATRPDRTAAGPGGTRP